MAREPGAGAAMTAPVQFFRFRAHDDANDIVIGAVMGLGGMLAGRAGVEALHLSKVRADSAMPMRGVSSAREGHIFVHPGYGAEGDGPAVEIDLRRYSVEVLRWRP